MAIVCSSCDATPEAAAVAGGSCTACGERLISIDTGDALIGTTIDGRFEVLGLLGQGGMGMVYRAKQLSIGREIALKVLDRRIEKDVLSVKRFFREAKLASTLAHPNTVPIIDFGQNAEGRLYLAMELIKGNTLLDEINHHGAMSLPRLVAIGVQLCDALEAAHDLQIIHRDLKLENVMLMEGKRDHIRILDFGLARSLVQVSTAMTAEGLISGTPRYMAPEVGFDAAPPAAPQDMYSIGVMLAELSVGRALWNAPTIELLFTQKLDTEKSITAVPAPIKPLIRSLLSTDPAQRPTAAQTRELLRALEHKPPALDLELEPEPRSSLLSTASSSVAHEPTATQIPVEVVDPFAKLDLVDLDEVGGAPKPAPRPVASAPSSHDGPLATLDDAFRAPPEISPATLEIDRSYVAERSARQTRRPQPVVVHKKSGAAGVIVSLLLIALVATGGYVFYTHRHTSERTLPGGGVTIRITASPPVVVYVDGTKYGVTPILIERPKSTSPILISAYGLAAQEIVPDHDQTVHLEP